MTNANQEVEIKDFDLPEVESTSTGYSQGIRLHESTGDSACVACEG